MLRLLSYFWHAKISTLICTATQGVLSCEQPKSSPAHGCWTATSLGNGKVPEFAEGVLGTEMLLKNFPSSLYLSLSQKSSDQQGQPASQHTNYCHPPHLVRTRESISAPQLQDLPRKWNQFHAAISHWPSTGMQWVTVGDCG